MSEDDSKRLSKLRKSLTIDLHLVPILPFISNEGIDCSQQTLSWDLYFEEYSGVSEAAWQFHLGHYINLDHYPQPLTD